MDTAIQIVVSGLTLGAMYAVSTIALSLVWGSLRMLNMAQGALLTAGGYAAYTAVVTLALPVWIGLPLAILVGAVIGALMYLLVVRYMLGRPGFETNVIIGTVGIALILENLVLRLYGAYPLQQPIGLPDGFQVGATWVPWQNVLILVVSILLMVVMSAFLERTRAGRAIRATAQHQRGAMLMGVPVGRVYIQVLMIGGALAAISGIMLSTITTLAPTMGYDPMLKAFIICVIAGLGNINGALFAAFALGLFEAAVQYFLGVRFGFPALLLLVIAALIWRPYGVFGRRKQARL